LASHQTIPPATNPANADKFRLSADISSGCWHEGQTIL
jgi:hypothetical protein